MEWCGVGGRRESERYEDRDRDTHRDRDRETQTETEIEPLEGEAARRRGTEQERPTAHTPFSGPCPLLPARSPPTPLSPPPAAQTAYAQCLPPAAIRVLTSCVNSRLQRQQRLLYPNAF